MDSKWTIGIADDILSGNDDDTKSDESHVFDVLYGTRHKFYGTMDFFNGAALRKRGLNDLNAMAALKASDKVDMSATNGNGDAFTRHGHRATFHHHGNANAEDCATGNLH